MTTSTDWSEQFDLLYNNISSNQAPGLLDEEKSIFLTQAQEALILDLYKGATGDSFESTEEVTRYLSSLVKSNALNITQIKDTKYEYSVDLSHLKNGTVWFITYQACRLNDNRDVLVIPTKQETLFKDLNNPFRGPNKNKVLCISEDNKIHLYSKYPINTFYIKYLKRPKDINLLDESFSVDIPESLHNQVLIRAVQMAKAVWQS